MPLYIPWLTGTIKKRGVRYLLHHYLGQFFEEKLTLDQLSIDIYEGKGSIKNLGLDVDGLNDELDFVPFKFLDGCLIGQISVEVPWSSLATDACKVELEGAKFVCRLKTSSDETKAHCTESTLLSRSLMTSSMQMAEDIVTTEDDDEYESPNSSIYRHQHGNQETSPTTPSTGTSSKRKDANQMFEGLEMFAQLIDSVLRRTKLTARDTLFQIQPHPDISNHDNDDEIGSSDGQRNNRRSSTSDCTRSTSGEEFHESGNFKSETDESSDYQSSCTSEGTVEFFIKFFRCEEVIEEAKTDLDDKLGSKTSATYDEGPFKRPLGAMPETITKLLTLEDVEMRIGGIPVSNLIGKHTIMIKFNGQKSEISIFSGSPLLAVIGHEQLKTFFNVFDGSKYPVKESSPSGENDQKVMSPEDYAKIENQLLETANLHIGSHQINDLHHSFGGSHRLRSASSVSHVGGRRWVDSSDLTAGSNCRFKLRQAQDFDYHLPNNPAPASCLEAKRSEGETTLDNIEAFSCELKLPGIWLCLLRDGESLPPLIKPYADSINSFRTINKYIDEHIKVAHLRVLGLKVALDITAAGINLFLGDLEISEHLQNESMNPVLHLLHNDLNNNQPLNSPRYKAHIVNNRDITVDLLTKTRILLDPTMIDRIVYDYKLLELDCSKSNKSNNTKAQLQQNILYDEHHKHVAPSSNQMDLNLTIKGDQFKVELLCPVPDLTPEGMSKPSQLRPQSFLFDFRKIVLNWDSDKLKVSANELVAYVKTQPQQPDNEAVKFIESMSKNSDKIALTLETSPSNLESVYPDDIEQTLNESSMYDSIYISQTAEARIPSEAFQTKRKVVRAHQQNQQHSDGCGSKPSGIIKSGSGNKFNDCDNEKIVTPADRQHLLNYLNQTVTSTNLSLTLHLPVCEVEFEDKEQLDLIYNRFGNDFVFWQPKALTKQANMYNTTNVNKKKGSRKTSSVKNPLEQSSYSRNHVSMHGGLGFGLGLQEEEDDDEEEEETTSQPQDSDEESENSFHSLSIDGSQSDYYDNELTCKIIVDEVVVRFNHQSCASAMKQEIFAENLLLGIVLDINKKPGTILSFVADNLELSTDSDVVLLGNTFGDKNSIFSLTAEIKRPTRNLKDIKLAVQLVNGLINDFKTDTYTRFWQSINVTDEPIMGYVAPKIVTELHVDILETALSIVRPNARPALLTIDELYMTSMVVEQTSQVMIRVIADEVSLYLKRNRQGQEIIKNYICLIDSGLIDLDMKFSQGGQLEFKVINNVITIRVCQDSLSALVKLFNTFIKNNSNTSSSNGATMATTADNTTSDGSVSGDNPSAKSKLDEGLTSPLVLSDGENGPDDDSHDDDNTNRQLLQEEMNLLEDAMNDFNRVEPQDDGSDGWSDTNSNSNGSGITNPDFANQLPSSNEGSFGVGGDNRRTSRHSSQSGVTSNEDETHDEVYDDDECSSDMGSVNDSDDSSSNSSYRISGAKQTTNTTAGISGARQRDPNACLLDESNPLIDGLFSQPLLQPPSEQKPASQGQKLISPAAPSMTSTTTKSQQLDSSIDADDAAMSAFNQRPIDESGFFVIGDDDVGAGIMNKQQHEPMVRKLIDRPINIIENHFKMTKPRTIPELLASSVERYVLEEMTLVVNLFGGRDFDDDCSSSPHPTSSSAAGTDAASSSSGGAGGGHENGNNNNNSKTSVTATNSSSSSSTATTTTNTTTTTATSATTTTTTNDDGEAPAATGTDTASIADSGSLRSRSGSVKKSPSSRKHYSSECCTNTAVSGSSSHSTTTGPGSSSWLKKRTSSIGGRRKHLSECGGSSARNHHQHQSTSGAAETRVRFGEGAVNLWESLDLMSSPDFFGSRRPSQPTVNSDTKLAGGTWRDSDVCIQLTLTKVKLLYELANPDTAAAAATNSSSSNTSAPSSVAPISWRFMLFIHDIEIKDRIHASDINKMLYEYCTESMPRRSAQMLTVKNVATINPTDGCEECNLRISLKPLRLNIDQDTLLFVIEFFTSFSKSLAKQQQSVYQAAAASSASGGPNSSQHQLRRGSSVTMTTTTTTSINGNRGRGESSTKQSGGGSSSSNAADSRKIGGAIQQQQQHDPQQARKCRRQQKSQAPGSSSSFSSSTTTTDNLDKQVPAAAEPRTSAELVASGNATTTTTACGRAGGGEGTDGKSSSAARVSSLPTHCHNSGSSTGQQAIYIKSFTFSPDVPIRLDYHAKHLDFEQGALAGILMGLAHLDHSELVLRRIIAKHGMRGLDRVLLFTLNSWISDIKRNQLPSILSGVGPMHSVIQLFQGMRDLIWMPIDHYRKDRRLVRGLQRGASSFSSSTAMAAINLMNRFISIVQCTAQIAHDIVTPPTFQRSSSGNGPGVGLTRAKATRYNHHHHHHHSVSTSQVSNLNHHHHHSSRHHVGTCKSSLASSTAITGLNQPRNFCEGVAVGYTILKEGFNDTARNVAVGMQAEDVRSAVGELVRQIPSTLLNPILSATEGAQNVLVGIRNQIAPDARREDQEKWKRRVRGK